jgi:hypothetical protein
MARRASLHSQQAGDEEACAHSGYYSGVGFYSREARMLRYVLVCDDCGEEMKEISALEYAPRPTFSPAV